MEPPETNPERFRREAAHLRQMAQNTTSDAIRQQLLDIAQGYEGLANTADILARQGRRADEPARPAPKRNTDYSRS